MNRTDFQLLAEARLADAKVLLDAGRWAAAYYLLGYAIECGLKACIARRFRQDEVPEKKIVDNFYTHRLEDLLKLSELQKSRDDRATAEPAFRISWSTVRDWNEQARYNHS